MVEPARLSAWYLHPHLMLSRSRCSFCLILWSLLCFTILIHFYPVIHSQDMEEVQARDLAISRELEQVEEEVFHLPPPRVKRSPRALKRKGPRKQPSVVDEFLDKSSDLRSFFFPGHTIAIDPRKEDDNLHYDPGRLWLDTDGNPIQAHGGGIMFDEKSETYYWYGENKDGPTYRIHSKGTARVDIIGVSCYSSKDLWAWKNEGIVLAGEETNATHDLHKSNILERPKVIYHEKTGQYVMWMHIDDANYTKASVGIAISNSPTGPFEYLYSKCPHEFESRDMTIFKDDDGKAYLIYSTERNRKLNIGPLTDDYLDVTRVWRTILVEHFREAPALFKFQGTYYMITSGCRGWAPNKALVHVAKSIMGPWETMGNPCVGGNKIFRMTTFFSQGSYVAPLKGMPGTFIFMADRWNPSELRDSRYVWLPLTVKVGDKPLQYNFGVEMWSRVSIYWRRRWRLPEQWGAS